MALTEEQIKQQACALYGVTYPDCEILIDGQPPKEETYEEDPPGSGNWIKKTKQERKFATEQVNAFVQAFVKYTMGLKFTTVIPLVGGGIPGPVSGTELPASGWIAMI